jgi:hypothetical protein
MHMGHPCPERNKREGVEKGLQCSRKRGEASSIVGSFVFVNYFTWHYTYVAKPSDGRKGRSVSNRELEETPQHTKSQGTDATNRAETQAVSSYSWVF